MALKYLVVVESGPKSFSAYVPDLPGCVAAGHTIDETLQYLQEAVKMHLEGIVEDGDAIPSPVTRQINLDAGNSIYYIAVGIMAHITS